jgi:hypothetical protein
LLRLSHVHFKVAHKLLYNEIFEPERMTHLRQPAGQARQIVLGYDMLKKDEQGIHGA